MSCRITRNENKIITRVETVDGAPSQLFAKVAKGLFNGDLETSLNIFGQSFTKEIKDLYEGVNDIAYTYAQTGEPRLFYRAEGNYVNESLEDIALNTQGGTIEIGFLNPQTNEFIEVGSINTNASPTNKTLFSLLRDGVISEDRVHQGEELLYKGAGYRAESLYSAREAKERIQNSTDMMVTFNEDGTFKIEDVTNFNTITTVDGGQVSGTHAELKEGILNGTIKPENLPLAIIQSDPGFVFNTARQIGNNKNVEDYLNQLTNFITSLGFSLTTMEEYKKAYKNRHGQDPDVNALIDLSEKVIAIAETSDVNQAVEFFTEEVAHLAVESYKDSNVLEAALLEVGATPEYSKYAEIYRKKYAEQYPNQMELETAVRKEILGKIIAEGIKSEVFSVEEAPNIITAFFNRVKSFFNPMQKRAIGIIKKEVNQAVLKNNTSNFATVTKSGVYYNLNPQSGGITDVIKKAYQGAQALSTLSKQERGALPAIVNTREVLKATEALNEVTILTSIQQSTEFAKLLSNRVDSKLKANDFNASDIREFEYLKNTMVSTLTEYQNFLSDRNNFENDAQYRRAQSVKKIVDSVKSDVVADTTRMDAQVTIETDRAYDEVGEAYSLPKEEVDKLKNIDKSVNKDVNTITMAAGMGSETANSDIQLLVFTLRNMLSKARSEFSRRMNPVVNKLIDSGLAKKYQNSTVQKTAKGEKTFYIRNFLKQAEYDANKEAYTIKTILSLREDLTEEEVKTRLKEGETVADILENEDLQLEFDARKRMEFDIENESRQMKAEFYKQRQEQYKTANVSLRSQKALETAKAQLYAIYGQKRLQVNGKIDKSLMTEEDKRLESFALASLKRITSPISGTGEFYMGLNKKKWADMTTEERNSIPKAILNKAGFQEFIEQHKGAIIISNDANALEEEARIALDNSNLNLLRAFEAYSNKRNSTYNDSFLPRLKELEARGNYNEAVEWALSNGVMRHSDLFYESQAEGNGFNEQVEEALNNITDIDEMSVKRDKFEDFKEASKLRSQIISERRDPREPSEIMAREMEDTVKAKVLELDARIATLKSELMSGLKRYLPNGFSSAESLTEMQVNKAFEADALKSGLSIYEFATLKENMTPANKLATDEFHIYLQKIFRPNPSRIYNKRFDEIIERYAEMGLVDLNPEQGTYNRDVYNANAIKALSEQFAKERVASFYKTYKLNSQDTIDLAFRTGEIKLSDMLNENTKQQIEERYPDLRYLEFTPDYTWADTVDTSMLNEEYNPEMGVQPLFEKYADREFIKELGVTEEQARVARDFEDVEKYATNKDMFEYFNSLYNMAKYSKENYNDNTSIYQLPQMSTSLFEKITKTRSKAGVRAGAKDLFNDMIEDRVDELEYGDDPTNTGIRALPRYFRYRLDDPEAITENFVSAYALMAYESSKYKEKNKAIYRVEMIKNKIGNQDYATGFNIKGKGVKRRKGEDSNSLKMAKGIVDHIMYGVKQTAKFEVTVGGKVVDVTKMVRTFQKISSFKNLALDPSIEVLSYVTGQQNLLVEKLTGAYTSTSGYKESSKLVQKIWAQATASIGKVNIDTEGVKLFEAFSMIDPRERLEESGSSRTARVLEDVPFMFAQIANSPIQARILADNIFDTRLVTMNGKKTFMAYQTYISNMQSLHPDMKMSDIKSSWNANKEFFYNYLDTSKEYVTFTPKFEEVFKDGSQAEFDRILGNISRQSTQQLQRVDSVINEVDRTALNRHTFGNLLMQHSGWLTIAMTRMFKGRHFNMSNGAYEEGTVKTLVNTTIELMKNAKSIDAMTNVIKDLSPMEQANLRRIRNQALSLMTVLALALSLMGSEDEDDTWAEEYSRYIAARWYNETKSNNPYGLYSVTTEKLKNPAVSIGLTEEGMSIMEKVVKGEFGDAKNEFLKKLPIKKGLAKIQDPSTSLNSFMYFNRESLWELELLNK